MDKLEQLFDSWVERNSVSNRKICYFVYKPRNPHFATYDDWKLASPYDYYEECDKYKKVDINLLYDFVCDYVNNNNVDLEKLDDDYFEDIYSNYEDKISEYSTEHFTGEDF